MNGDDYITFSEFLIMVAIYMGPSFAVGGFLQGKALYRRGLGPVAITFVLLVTFLLTAALAWPLMYALPWLMFSGMGSSLVLPGLVATVIVTGMTLAVIRLTKRPA